MIPGSHGEPLSAVQISRSRPRSLVSVIMPPFIRIGVNPVGCRIDIGISFGFFKRLLLFDLIR